MKYTFLTILALGAAAIANAQPGQNQNSIDSHALNAIQINVRVQFGPGTTVGSFQCPNQRGNTPGYCIARLDFNLPNGKRFVVENMSVGVSYNPNGSGLVLLPAIDFLVNVGNSAATSTFPFDSSIAVNGGTQYFMNKNVRFYIDPGIGFPEIFLLNNSGSLIPGDLGAATGSVNMTLQGYLVDLN